MMEISTRQNLPGTSHSESAQKQLKLLPQCLTRSRDPGIVGIYQSRSHHQTAVHLQKPTQQQSRIVDEQC